MGSAFTSVAALQRACRSCTACHEAGFPVVGPPIFAGRAGQRALLVGQAPGAVEVPEGLPWRGRAGQTLRRWLGLPGDELYETFYCCSATRCFPGRSRGGRGDRAPSARELDLCDPWLRAELRLLDPALVVTVGAVAARRLLGLERLGDRVGTAVALGTAIGIPLPHPSGASGFLNDRTNRARLERALLLVRESVTSLREES